MRLAAIAVCASAALALAACGSSNDKSSSSSNASTTPAPAATGGSEQKLALRDFRFDPNAIKGKPGQKVTLELKNDGKVEHNFSVASQHIDKDVEAGEDAKVSVTLPKSGTLQFFCSYHKASHNMVGSFTVGGASTPKPAPTNTSGGGSGY